MNPNVLMLIGGLARLIGELWGVKRNAGRNTTSEWVWWAEVRWPILRPLVGLFVLSLFGHFMWHWMLLP